uniref:Uncharacterized protein n=1 Tax=Triticum urartu TaxID=4572 RepID=A0A8R7K4W2_TRIUA
MPSFITYSSSRSPCDFSSSVNALTPFSPKALSEMFRYLSTHPAKALENMRITSRASSSGLPATKSEISTSVSCDFIDSRIGPATLAAPIPKLLLLKQILLYEFPGFVSGLRSSFASSASMKARLPPDMSNTVSAGSRGVSTTGASGSSVVLGPFFRTSSISLLVSFAYSWTAELPSPSGSFLKCSSAEAKHASSILLAFS